MMTHQIHRVFIALALACAFTAGCAKLPGLGSQPDDESPGVVIRADAPPEFDLLVAQEFQQAGRMREATAAYERAVAKDPESAFLRRRLAEALVRQNRVAEGIEHAQRAYDLEPDDMSLRLLLGQLHQISGSPAEAEKVLRNEDGEPAGEDAAFQLYEIYLSSRRIEKARETAEWLVDRHPESIRNRLALAAVYSATGRSEQAERILRRAIDEDPDNLRAYVALARSHRERGDHEGEIAVFNEILARSPHHHAALVSLSNAQLKANDLEGAQATLEEIEEYHPDDVNSAARLAFLYYEQRRWAEAADRFARVAAANPEEHQILFFLGVVQRRSGHPDRAVASFESIPPASEHYAEARTQIAALYERRERYAEALAEVEKAHSVKPSRQLELYAATLRSKLGDFDGAIAHLERMLEAEPESDELLYNLGVVYGEADRTDESIAYMQRALEENPDNASALNYIGYTWAERGIKLDEAETLISRALALRPEDGYIADSLGWVYYMRALPLVEDDRVADARQYIERALEELERADDLTGGDPVVSEHIGDTYLLLDQKRRALDHFEEAVRLEPRYGEQPNLLEKLEKLRDELR
ncbi:MAG: tetratricopeptide repeat protein [Myxococcota bacterium]